MSVTAGYEGAGASVEATIASTFKQEMTKQTGHRVRRMTSPAAGRSPRQSTRKVAGFLTWDEQTLDAATSPAGPRLTAGSGLARGTTATGITPCHGQAWEDLISTIEGKGSVKMPARDYFIDKPVIGQEARCRLRRFRSGTTTSGAEYKGANAINIKVNSWKRDANGKLVAVTQPKKK